MHSRSSKPNLVHRQVAAALGCLAGAATAPGHAADTDAAATELAEVKVVSQSEEADGSAAGGYRNRSVTLGPLGTKPLAEVPYSVSVTPASFIENVHANRPTEALRYDPTVNPEMGSNRSGDYLAVRGFINSSNQAIDGMRANVASGGWLEDKERVEVLSGATSFLYGIASPAGMVNYVLKRPTATPAATLSIGSYGGAQAFAHLDAGGPLDTAGRFGYRLNVMGVDDGNTGVDEEHQPRSLLSTAIDWHLTADTLLSFDAARYHQKLKHAQAYFFVTGITEVPSAPDASKSYSAPYAVNEESDETLGVQLSSRINDRFSLRAALRHSRADLRYAGVRNRFVDNDGNYTQEMMYYRAPRITTENRGHLFVDVAFRTGPLAHTLTAGYIGSSVEVNSAGTSTYKFPTSTIVSMYDPIVQADPNVNTFYPAFVTQKSRQDSLLLADDIRIDERWSLLAGANRTHLDDKGYSTSNGSLSSSYDEQAVTPSLALMYKPVPGALVYASYIEALEQGDTAPSTAANSGEVLEPYLSTQYELGAKFTLGQMDFKAALFRIEKDSAYTDPVSNVYSADGRQVHRGVEFSFTGRLSERLTLLGGFSTVDAERTRSDNAALVGKTPQAVPDWLARLYGEYALPAVPGLVLSAGLSHTGAAWADDLNTKSYPGVTVGDLGLRYVSSLAGHKTTYRLTISNVTDKSYWTSKGGSMLYLGSPRTLAASASFDF